MKYLCEGCERLVEMARFRLAGAELVLTCSRCGVETIARSSEPIAQPIVAEDPRSTPVTEPAVAAAPAYHPVPAPAPARPPAPMVVPLHAVPSPTFGEDPFAVPEDRCPKCVAPRPVDALTCRQCGLVFANFVPEEHQPAPELRTAWTDLTQRWDDLGAHDQALSGAAIRGDLAGMGRLYRIRLARQPRDPIASRGRDEVLRLAATTSALVSSRPASGAFEEREGSRTTLLVAAAAMLVGSLMFLVWLLLRA